VRPRELLRHDERRTLSQSVIGIHPMQRTKEEVLSMIQSAVDLHSSARATFNKFDEDRSGRLTVNEFVAAMRDLHVDVSTAQAEDVISEINRKAGSKTKASIGYRCFANYFNRGEDLANQANVERRGPDHAELDVIDHQRPSLISSAVPAHSSPRATPSRSHAQRGGNIMPSAVDMPNHTASSTLSPSISPSRRSLRLTDADSWSGTMRECLQPDANSAAFLHEGERMIASSSSCGSLLSASSSQQADREARIVHRRVAKEAYAQQTAAIEQRIAQEEDKLSGILEGRYRAAQRAAQRTSDLQLVVESRLAFDDGRKPVVYEPPSKPSWAKPAAPHLVSHWDTIAAQYRDPPPRKHERSITSYRRAFPDMEQRPPTPSSPIWGGA